MVFRTSIPSRPGILTSRSTMAAARAASLPKASLPSAAVRTSRSRRSNTWAMPLRTVASSSTIKTCLVKSFPGIGQSPAPGSRGPQYPESGAHIHFAFHVHRTLMGLDDSLDNGQTQSGADHLPGFGVLDPVKFVKNFGQFFRVDADAVIPHLDFQEVIPKGRGNSDFSPIRGIVDGVADEIGEALLPAT